MKALAHDLAVFDYVCADNRVGVCKRDTSERVN